MASAVGIMKQGRRGCTDGGLGAIDEFSVFQFGTQFIVNVFINTFITPIVIFV